MLAARSVGWNDPGAGAPVGIYMVGLLQRLGIAEEMKPKIVAFKQRSERMKRWPGAMWKSALIRSVKFWRLRGSNSSARCRLKSRSYTSFAAGIVNSGNGKDGRV